MTQLTRSEQMLAEKTVCVLLVRGEDPDGQGIYAYVAVRADRLEAFMAAQSSGTFYPEDYGVVVESGIGDPDEDTRKRMETEYGFNHEQMIDIPDAGHAADLAHEMTAPQGGPSGDGA